MVRIEGHRSLLDRLARLRAIRAYHPEAAVMEIQGKRVLVVGLGKSGVSAALFLRSRGARVTVSDSKAESELSREIPALLDKGIVVETGAHGERTFRDQDLIVLSPGVPLNTPQLEQARGFQVPVIGEVELASRFLQGRIIAITGSNGKTTTTSLVGEILTQSGLKAQVGGNIGTPVTELIEGSTPETWNVLEISSFQLESVESFRPKIACILNVTPDHLDRHGTFEAYVAAKARIFEQQGPEDFAVLNAANDTCLKTADGLRAPVYWFSSEAEVKQGSFARDGEIFWRRNAMPETILPVSEIALKGKHNLENVLAAVTIAKLAGCANESIRSSVRDFKAVEHRLEHITTIDGVQYFNDSKATNVDATIKALESFPAGIHLILGGKDKGSDYTVLKPLLKQRAKRVYTIGAAADKIESHITGAVPIIHAGTLDRAVRLAAENAASGDVVVLAPACSSFDQFDNYEHRGRVFRQLVEALAARGAVNG
jgi:UDP-N-acetylmuramoylalanine--D-glutamate ligase